MSISSAGTHAGSLAVADFNGDGKTDIAVSNFDSNTAAVFLNQGNGAFSTPVINTIQIPNGLGALAEGDFNQDGKMDLLVATISGPQVTLVLLGNGDGSFVRAADIPNSFGFLHGRVADLNADKHLDYIGCDAGNIQVALGNGDGSFQPVLSLPSGPFPNTYFGCDVGDFNCDKKLDIFGAVFMQNTTNLVLFEGNGDGTFQARAAISGGSSDPDSVAAADFNGDGKLDVLVGFEAGSSALLSGEGNGNFGMPVVVPSVNGVAGVTVLAADLNNDGKPEALAADYTNGIFSITLSPSVLQEAKSHTFDLAPGLNDIAVGDLNGDGLPDIALSNGLTDQITMLLSEK